MPANYVLIREITLNASAASVTIDNIPQTGYTDLKLEYSTRCTTPGLYGGGYQQAVFGRFNSSTTSYTNRWIQAEGGTSVNSGTDYFGSGTTYAVFGSTDPSDWTANTFGNGEVYIPNYTGSQNKSFSTDTVGENNGSFGTLLMNAGLWSSSAAISSITFSLPSGSFAAGSSFSLYGIAAVGTTPTVVPKASGGDIITNDGTYWYHAFLASGTFIPNTGLSCDYLVVAGGGGGGTGTSPGGGGGGAGGLRSTVGATGGGGSLESALSLIAQNYTVTVGAGGATDTSGTNSVFSTITSIGGGRGGASSGAGAVGGSGGGGSTGTTPQAAAAGTTGQGYAGGSTTTTPQNNYGSAGGGGSGAVGGNGTTSAGGAGGIGVAISAFATPTSTGVSSRYAGGGGGGCGQFTGANGGAGGAGGGGTGGSTNGRVSPTAGTTNTGSGGGGAFYEGSSGVIGAAGGSGIVIIRYAMA